MYEKHAAMRMMILPTNVYECDDVLCQCGIYFASDKKMIVWYKTLHTSEFVSEDKMENTYFLSLREVISFVDTLTTNHYVIICS